MITRFWFYLTLSVIALVLGDKVLCTSLLIIAAIFGVGDEIIEELKRDNQ